MGEPRLTEREQKAIEAIVNTIWVTKKTFKQFVRLSEKIKSNVKWEVQYKLKDYQINKRKKYLERMAKSIRREKYFRLDMLTCRYGHAALYKRYSDEGVYVIPQGKKPLFYTGSDIRGCEIVEVENPEYDRLVLEDGGLYQEIFGSDLFAGPIRRIELRLRVWDNEVREYTIVVDDFGSYGEQKGSFMHDYAMKKAKKWQEKVMELSNIVYADFQK